MSKLFDRVALIGIGLIGGRAMDAIGRNPDASGKVVDGATGRVSNGCIRTGEAEAVFTYAEVGMPVFVHA